MMQETKIALARPRYDTYELLSGLRDGEMSLLRKMNPQICRQFDGERRELLADADKIVGGVNDIARKYVLLFFEEQFFKEMRKARAGAYQILLEERKRLRGDEAALAEIARDHEDADRELERQMGNYMEEKNLLSLKYIGEDPEEVQESLVEDAADLVVSKTRGLGAGARKSVYSHLLSALNGRVRRSYPDANALIDSAIIAILESETYEPARFDVASGFPARSEDEKCIPPLSLTWANIRDAARESI